MNYSNPPSSYAPSRGPSRVLPREVHVITLEDSRGCSSWACNVIWALLFGWECFLSWVVVGLVLCLSIIGIPFGLQCFKLARVVLFPFGKKLVRRGVSTRCIDVVFNLLWLPFGLVIAIEHFLFGLVCYLSIIGIPFGVQHCKFAEMALCPFGVDTTVLTVSHHQIDSSADRRLLV